MNKTTSMNCALILIAVALAGAVVSYHFTLDSRFATIETKLEQNSVALQQFQIAQETLVSGKTETLNTLNKEIENLQASMAPLGRATHEQTDALSDIHKQIASLQQTQQAQVDAQKKLSDYAAQLDKIKHDIQAQSTPPSIPSQVQLAPATTSPVVTSPVVIPVLAPHASSANILLPLPPRADSAVDIRPDQSTSVAEVVSNRALPVALPVSPALSDSR